MLGSVGLSINLQRRHHEHQTCAKTHWRMKWREAVAMVRKGTTHTCMNAGYADALCTGIGSHTYIGVSVIDACERGCAVRV